MGLFEALSADAVIADYAPTAELAALCLGLPRMSIGHGFYPPPTDNRPIPPFMPGGASAAQRSDLESRIDRTLAGVGRRLGVEATLNLGKLLTPDELALTTIPELDFYRRPSTEDYLGLLPGSTATVPAASPRGEVTFVYLHATHPATRPVLDALRDFDAPVVACLPGADAKLLQSLREQGVAASTRPHDLDSVAPRCRVAVTHGGLGTVLRFALHGCGQVAVPTQPEQRTMAQRMAEAGIGRVLPRVPEAEALRDTLEQAAGYTGGSAARQFVAQHRWAHPPQSTERFRAMVARLAGSD
jgi:UDP:flavonoid glycosyltransferase YjiC (YdhE family)